MPKYGRGLNREVVSAVNRGIIKAPITIDDVKCFVKSNNWSVPDSYKMYVLLILLLLYIANIQKVFYISRIWEL